MSYKQIKNSVRNKDCYALCCVEMTDYYPKDGNRYKVENLASILDRVSFLNMIGYKIEPLIVNAIAAEANEDEVKLTEEYRAVIPQAVVKTGTDLDSFINFLIDFLNLAKINTTHANPN